jgi:hypothetical protein
MNLNSKQFVSIVVLAVMGCIGMVQASEPDKPPAMKKRVTEQAGFVLYLPAGWRGEEDREANLSRLRIADADGKFKAALTLGAEAGGDVQALARRQVGLIGQRYPDLSLRNVQISPDRSRLTFDAVFSEGKSGRRELRAWLALRDGRYQYTTISAPEGQLEGVKPMLLSVLANVRVTRAMNAGDGRAALPPLQPYRLADGSARLMIPAGWRVRELGKGQFIASDRAGTPSFMVASADVLTPALGVRVPGVPVSPYLSPDRAWRFLTGAQGLARNMNFIEVNPRPEIAAQIAQVYTAGPVQVADFLYTCDTREGASTGYTLGISFGSRLGSNWNFRHITVAAPSDRFGSYAPLFAAMLRSYALDEGWVKNYVQQGMQRLRQMEQDTARKVARNAEDIHQMMQAAYDERQKSQDYLDYQRSQSIRGEQDWISSMEGGTVYHTDSWGTRNTATGETWEGQPYDYVRFSGRNPKHNEDMTPIDSRELWERYRR